MSAQELERGLYAPPFEAEPSRLHLVPPPRESGEHPDHHPPALSLPAVRAYVNGLLRLLVDCNGYRLPEDGRYDQLAGTASLREERRLALFRSSEDGGFWLTSRDSAEGRGWQAVSASRRPGHCKDNRYTDTTRIHFYAPLEGGRPGGEFTYLTLRETFVKEAGDPRWQREAQAWLMGAATLGHTVSVDLLQN